MHAHPQTVQGLLAEQRGQAIALIYRGREFSYAALDDLSRHVAGALRERGVGPGDRVAFWLPNCPAYVILYLACTRLGAAAVAINTRYRSVEVSDLVVRSRCRALAVWPGFRQIDFAGILATVPRSAFAGLETLIVCGQEDATIPEGDFRIDGVHTVPFETLTTHKALDDDFSTPDSVSNIFTTSGTTKLPKLVLHRQSALVFHARNVARAFGYDAADARIFQAIPLCGVFGFCQLLATFAAGAPLVLEPAFDADEAARLIRSYQVTHTIGPDDLAERLLHASSDSQTLRSLRHFGYAQFNSALVDIVQRADARGLVLCGLYGSSELQALFSAQPTDAPAERRCLAGGIPVSGEAEVRARNRTTGAILMHEEEGELEIKCPSIMVGYDGNDDATRMAFTEDGFFRTGDLGYTVSDGSFVYLCRLDDSLRLRGFLVNPAEIESHLLTHDAVDGCQAIGAETSHGTVAVAFVTLKAGAVADESALRNYCLGSLAAHKVPEYVFIIEAFPTTQSANGTKIQRTKLRQIAQEWIDAQAAAGVDSANASLGVTR